MIQFYFKVRLMSGDNCHFWDHLFKISFKNLPFSNVLFYLAKSNNFKLKNFPFVNGCN